MNRMSSRTVELVQLLSVSSTLDDENDDVTLYSKCIYKTQHGKLGTTYQQHTVIPGDVLEVVVNENIRSEVLVTQ